MGTDIHGLFQHKNKNNPYWHIVPQTFVGELFNLKMPDNLAVFFPRNYEVFGLLAGVRNGVGFANIKTGEPVTPISKPKGLPIDRSAPVSHDEYDWYYVSDIGVGYHDFSYLTLDEMILYPHWNAVKVNCGYLNEKEFQEYDATGIVRSCSGDVDGPNIVKVSERNWRAGKHLVGPKYYIFVEWKEPLTDNWVYKVLMPNMQVIKDKFDAEEVRFVFGFDS
jgi:hypothetical protein